MPRRAPAIVRAEPFARRSWALCGLLCAAVGCSTAYGGEVSAARCADEEDNDGDDLVDCRDPDCQAYEHCSFDGASGSGGSGGGGAGGRDDPPPAGTGGRGGDGGHDGDDAGSDPDEDAGAVDAGPSDAGTTCGGGCASGEVCIAGECEPVSVVAEGRYSVRVTLAEVPYFNAATRCFDDFCEDMPISPPFAFCLCAPDAFVQLVRVRGSEETRIGRTPPVLDSDMPDFSDDAFVVDLEPGDALRFSLWDQDLASVEIMYECPDVTPLPSNGAVSCSKIVFGQTEFRIEAELTRLGD